MSRRGFSLVEMLVVLILIALSIGLVTPSLSRFLVTAELKGAAQKISAILRNSRSEAVHRGTTVQVLFDPLSQVIQIHPLESTEEEGKEKKRENEPSSSRRTYVLPKGIELKRELTASSSSSSDPPPIEFYPNGGSNGGAILLNSPHRIGYRIDVHLVTGRVEVRRAK